MSSVVAPVRCLTAERADARRPPAPCPELCGVLANAGLAPPPTGSHTRPGPSAGKPKYVAVAVCNQKSTSAIVTLKSSGIDRPAKLDGTVYASYAARWVRLPSATIASPLSACAVPCRGSPPFVTRKKYDLSLRYEGRIVQRLIQADGGKGDYTARCPHEPRR